MMEPGKEEAAPSAPSIGPIRRFGRYTLVKKLATGGMAEIWLARQRGLAGFNRFVVIKKILSHLSEQETFVKMFLDEARTSSQLNHPNVVQIYDLGREGDSYYIAMEFIAGENLAAIAWRGMKRGRPLSPQFAARVIADTCKALHYAHHLRGSDGKALEIVHRDISPQNILVTYEGEIKVVDFGIAKATTKSEHTKTGMLKGKFSYMSPEQCLGTPVDMRSDIFALGILLYELCTGKRLFKHESELMILEMITKRSVVPPSQVAPGISPRLESVIMTALEKSTESRYQTAQDMQIALEDYLRDDERSATNADIAQYMRQLFEDKIEEKRLLREAASRDDFESAFGDEEPTQQSVDSRQTANKRRVVHGLPPSQVKVGPPGSMPGSLPPGMRATGQMPMHVQGAVTPGAPMPSQSGMQYPPGAYGTPGVAQMSYPGGISYNQSLTGGVSIESSSWIARLVIAGALVVILVASAILYQQLVRGDPPPVPTNTNPVQLVPPKVGKLLLDSSPSGAVIYLDGRPMQLDNREYAKTPSDLTHLQYGTTYKIRLVKEGHDAYEQEVYMDASTDGSQIKPALKARPGRVIAEVTGANARDVRVFFGGEDVGLGPVVEREIKAHESVVITAKIPGQTCTAEPQRFRVVPDQITRVTIRCEAGAERQPRSEPPLAVRKGGPGSERRDPAPPRDREPARREEAALAAGGGGCRPTPGLPAGYATINTTPWADIYIGARKIGETPLSRHKLPAGCVEIRAVTKEGKSRSEKITIEPNKVSIFKFDIK